MMISLLQQDQQYKLIHTLYVYDTSEAAQKESYDYFQYINLNANRKVISAGSLDEILQNTDITWVMIASKNFEHCS